MSSNSFPFHSEKETVLAAKLAIAALAYWLTVPRQESLLQSTQRVSLPGRWQWCTVPRIIPSWRARVSLARHASLQSLPAISAKLTRGFAVPCRVPCFSGAGTDLTGTRAIPPVVNKNSCHALGRIHEVLLSCWDKSINKKYSHPIFGFFRHNSHF